ncbi:ATP-binding protein [Sinorhizobium meliloti]|uniref:ATP-binding protein n=1 Tax=Rhizobium meliloti TaxID=382 RepID=UPI000FD7CE12|nr:ATP-binding protein [Sinorhizobium meliloti]RVQ09478.1 ATP-binding protein [Sinorhizobium meliloti]
MNTLVVLPIEPAIAAESIGDSKSRIPVEISTRFLEHFSEQLYSSPQKAFEELISNSWDAGANVVDVRIANDLTATDASMAVLDNGVSMDEAGLRALWHIAFSPKRDLPVQHGRRVVGKFGIGKLATYVLASRLTYICKAADGIIRRVTMDYGSIDGLADSDKLVSQLDLELFEVAESDLEAALGSVAGGAQLLELIRTNFKDATPGDPASNEDFGAQLSDLVRSGGDTWTLVILSGLKQTGRELKLGVLKRMLEAALPLSSEMTIRINGEVLQPSKLVSPVSKEWIIGPDLNITELEIDRPVDDEDDLDASEVKAAKAYETLKVTSGLDPYPYVDLPEIGRVTGRVKLYVDKISGGKSEERGSSNGFLVNVLGRVVNQSDPSFGAENLSHAAWARFRMTVRADGLNSFLNTNREQFREQRALKIFRSFLRKAFNIARSNYDSDANVEMPDGGDLLVKSLGVLSLAPLRSVVSEALRTQPPIPGLFDETGIDDRDQKREDWRKNTADHIQNALSKVKYERLDDGSFVKFRIADNTIVVNRDHPFVAEHSRTKAEKELMRTVAMVNLLSDVFALENGVEPSKLHDVREYRDQLMRFRALQRRQSGTHIAQILLNAQHNSANSRELEVVLADALRYLGFQVKEIGGSGEPEGIATAYSFSQARTPTDDDPKPPLYKFTYDAKSSKHETAKTGNLSLDGINEHRLRYKADYALVVAPGFEAGALPTRAEQQKVSPIRARDLGRLLEYTVEYGAIPLDVLANLFQKHHPDDVTSWIDELEASLKKSRKLTIDVFLKALEILRGKVPDVLAPSLISFTCREVLGVATVVDQDVIRLIKGLSILVPDLIGIDDNDRIVVNASSERVAAAVSAQLEKLQNAEGATEGE